MTGIYTKPISRYLKNTRIQNLLGLTFGRLLVVQFAGTNKWQNAQWLCVCKCGNTVTVPSGSLRGENTQSCGCYCKDRISETSTTHGESRGNTRTTELITYKAAKKRCTKPNDKSYKHYGGRGIEFRFNSFEEFLTEVGRKPTPKHSIERKDVNGHYEVGNVTWATPTEQANNKRTNILITAQGKTMSRLDWAKETGIDALVIYKRIKYQKWCEECAVSTVRSFTNRCPHKS